MITRSDNPPLTAEKIAARRRLVAVVAVVAVFAVGYYLFALHAAADRDARRRPIQAKINQLRNAEQSFGARDIVLTKAWNAYQAETTAASAAGQARHDSAVGSDPSVETSLTYAKKELAQINAAMADFQIMKDGYAQAQAADDALFGADAVQKYRTDAQAYTTAESVGLDDWSRAISLIVDDEKIAIRDDSNVNTNDDSISSASIEWKTKNGLKPKPTEC